MSFLSKGWPLLVVAAVLLAVGLWFTGRQPTPLTAAQREQLMQKAVDLNTAARLDTARGNALLDTAAARYPNALALLRHEVLTDSAAALREVDAWLRATK